MCLLTSYTLAVEHTDRTKHRDRRLLIREDKWFQQMPFRYLTHGDREVFFFFKSVRIASYVRKPVKTVKIHKTHVKNVQVDTSASTTEGSLMVTWFCLWPDSDWNQQ